MQNQKRFRIILTIACFVFAGLNAYQILQGSYTYIDVVLMIVFLLWGGLYIYLLRKDRQQGQ
ncbi:hypothetical protein [Pontibacter sp. SGAir0037]|uniref:hypothetical protein n=1 Tax=Pontibacter sp. SGAir0037 TaxID=2571030 RepID=UPI0010CD429D|nr:hypothetical protein [Pontibacter sp. SGAir0037]QCR21044.1 hypothetical protein C1N53_00795 [Pontibacter sp. SGAir0037]